MSSPSTSVTDPFVALITVKVVEARKLPKMDVVGSSDPYVIIKWGDNERRTSVIKNNLNPVWNETFKFLVRRSQQKYNVEFDLYDYDWNTKDDFMGSTTFDVSLVMEKINKDPIDMWFKVIDPKKPNADHGEVHLQISAKDKKKVEWDFWTKFASYFDADQTRTISFLEFTALMEAIQTDATDEEIHQLFQRGDVDKDHQISYEEFCNLLSSDAENVQKNPILHKVLPEKGGHDFIWEVSAKSDDVSNVGQLMMERGFYGQVSVREGKEGKYKIMVHDRSTGKLVEEKIPEYIRVAMKMMYSTSSGRFAIEGSQLKRVLLHLTEQQAKKYNSPESKKEIEHFIKFHGLNVDEILDPMDSFKTFNEFFYRKLKKSARAIAGGDNHKLAVSPADCRLNVFQTVSDAQRIWIKGRNFTLQNLIQDQALATQFQGGAMVIARLAPQDYHRFHSPVSGVVTQLVPFAGTLYTVNPIAIRENVDVYTENKRVRGLIRTKEFGDVLYIAVGATMVGSIHFTKKVGDSVNKGEELGYFAFGGSTIILVFQAGSINFDSDLLVNSHKPIETLVKMGESLGVAAAK